MSISKWNWSFCSAALERNRLCVLSAPLCYQLMPQWVGWRETCFFGNISSLLATSNMDWPLWPACSITSLEPTCWWRWNNAGLWAGKRWKSLFHSLIQNVCGPLYLWWVWLQWLLREERVFSLRKWESKLFEQPEVQAGKSNVLSWWIQSFSLEGDVMLN